MTISRDGRMLRLFGRNGTMTTQAVQRLWGAIDQRRDELDRARSPIWSAFRASSVTRPMSRRYVHDHFEQSGLATESVGPRRCASERAERAATAAFLSRAGRTSPASAPARRRPVVDPQRPCRRGRPGADLRLDPRPLGSGNRRRQDVWARRLRHEERRRAQSLSGSPAAMISTSR